MRCFLPFYELKMRNKKNLQSRGYQLDNRIGIPDLRRRHVNVP